MPSGRERGVMRVMWYKCPAFGLQRWSGEVADEGVDAGGDVTDGSGGL